MVLILPISNDFMYKALAIFLKFDLFKKPYFVFFGKKFGFFNYKLNHFFFFLEKWYKFYKYVNKIC